MEEKLFILATIIDSKINVKQIGKESGILLEQREKLVVLVDTKRSTKKTMRTSMEEKNKAMSERIAELRSLRTQLSSSFYSRKDKISSSHSQSFTKSPYASFLDGKEGEERERQSSNDGEGMSRKSSKDSLKSHSNRDILIPDAIIVDSDGSEDDGDDNEDIAKVKQGEKAMSTASKGLLPSTPSRSQSIPPTNYLLGRYQASIKLLAESLEEQYNLRAVLDLLLTQPTTTKKHEISSNESKSSNKMLPQTMNELEELLQHDLLHLTSTYYQQTTPLPSNIPSNSSIFTNSQPISSLFSIQDLQENVSNLQKDNNNDENNHGEVSAEFLCNVKYKSLLLQQDKLIAQVCALL